jgi:hypothetical protein
MDAGSDYNLALFLHITGALAMFAALTMEGIAVWGIRRATSGAEGRTWLGLMRPTRMLGPASLGLILLPGIYLAANVDSPGGWIGASLLGFVVIAILGATINLSRMAVVGKALGQAQGPLGEQTLRIVRDRLLAVFYAMRIGIALGIVWLMTLKPGFVPSLFVLGFAAATGFVAGRVLSGRSPEGASDGAKAKAS